MSEAATSKFWDYLSKRLVFEAPLHNWRMELGDQINFEKFRKNFLIPTDGFAESIICPEPCGKACPRRVIKQYHQGGSEAVCREWENDFFPIAEEEILIHKLQKNTLLKAVAAGLGIPLNACRFQTIGKSWRMGNFPAKGIDIQVFLTLQNWGYEVLDFILNLNRMCAGPYLLLGMNKQILNPSSEQLLTGHGAKFIPLNETLDFNCDTELALMRPLDIVALFTPPVSELETEPDNIFRKCGESWEIRFDGGEKFMLNSADTGAIYLHFMLGRPNTMIPIIEIMRGASGESGGYKVDALLNSDGILDGYALADLPMTGTGNIADDKAIRQYRREAELLLGEIDKARDVGDNITLQQLQQDMEKINRSINEAVSPSGQKKKFTGQIKNIVDAFRSAVNFAIDKIVLHEPSLAEHLRRTIKYGQEPGYFSDNNINWKL